jgi:hypothetical protein
MALGHVAERVTRTLVRHVSAAVCTRTGLVVAKAKVAAVPEAEGLAVVVVVVAVPCAAAVEPSAS